MLRQTSLPGLKLAGVQGFAACPLSKFCPNEGADQQPPSLLKLIQASGCFGRALILPIQHGPERDPIKLGARNRYLSFDPGELPDEDPHKEVPGATRRLKDPAVDTERLVLDQIEHRLGHPSRREDLAVVRPPLP